MSCFWSLRGSAPQVCVVVHLAALWQAPSGFVAVRLAAHVSIHFEIISHIFQCIFLQPADLCLGDADFFRHLHLGFSLKEA